MADDIKQKGLIQPIIVRRDTLGNYIVIAGERRFKACELNKSKTIKAIVASYNEEDIGYVQVSENIKRDELKFYELAEFILDRVKKGEKQTAIADHLGFNNSTVTRYMSWQSAPDFIKEAKDKFNSIRTFSDLVNIAKDSDKEELIKEFVINSEKITRQDVANLKKELKQEIQENDLSKSTTADEGYSNSLDSNLLNSENNKEALEKEKYGLDNLKSESDKESELAYESEQIDTDSYDVEKNASSVLSNEIILESSESTKSIDNVHIYDSDSEKMKKPLIIGYVDNREAELLYKEKPSNEGFVKVKYEDGFIEEILAEKYKINRIIEA